MLCPYNNEDCDNPGCRHGGCQGRKPTLVADDEVADDEFAWVPSWLSDPAPPTPAAIRGAETLRKLRAAALALLCLIGTAWGDGLPILPDDVLTPGVIASTDQAEVCATGPNGTYSQQHRQTSAAMKRAVFERYGIDKATAGEVEVDHRGPLCAGFADDIRNLWIQPGNGHGTHWTFHLKDAVEALACRQICSGKVSLSEAQSWFLAPADWRRAYCEHFADPACDTLAAQ